VGLGRGDGDRFGRGVAVGDGDRFLGAAVGVVFFFFFGAGAGVGVPVIKFLNLPNRVSSEAAQARLIITTGRMIKSINRSNLVIASSPFQLASSCSTA